jgi:hypothetical protein
MQSPYVKTETNTGTRENRSARVGADVYAMTDSNASPSALPGEIDVESYRNIQIIPASEG